MWNILQQTLTDFRRDKCTRIAAALAYYTAFSLAPMLLLVISVCQLIFDPGDIRGQVQSEVASLVGPEGVTQLETMLETDDQQQQRGILATVISLAVMLLGATGLFVQLQDVMNDVWQVQPKPSKSGWKTLIAKRLISLGMVLTIAFLLMMSLTASSLLHALDASIDEWLPGGSASALLIAGEQVLSFVVIALLFAAMFKFLPDARIAWSDVWIGAITTALLFIAGKYAIAAYLGNKSFEDTYGAAGSLVLLLLWVYYSALIFLLGAEFTQAWAKLRGRGIIPDRGAVRVEKRLVTHDVNSV